MNYAKSVKKLREKLFLTQQELAKILEINYTTISRWEKGKFTPTIKAKKKLNDLFIKYNIQVDEKGEY